MPTNRVRPGRRRAMRGSPALLRSLRPLPESLREPEVLGEH